MRVRVEQEWQEIDEAFDRLPDQGRAHRLLFWAYGYGGRHEFVERLQELLGLDTVEQTMRFVVHRIRQPMPHYNRLIALHEAAHAVADVTFRHNLRYVVLRPRAKWRDGWALSRSRKLFVRQVDGTARRRWSRQHIMRAAEKHVISILVGFAAMTFADPSWSVNGDEDDFFGAFELVAKVYGDDEAEGEYDRLWEAADNFVRRHWLAISAVGESLLERETLTGHEVRRIMEAAKETEQEGSEQRGH
jgi:hypothetical protein